MLSSLRRQVQDARVLRLLEMRHGQAHAVELARDVDCKAAIPVFRIDLLDLPRGTGNAGIVDQAIQPAQRLERIVEQPGDLRAVGHVAHRLRKLRVAALHLGKRLLVDIADVHLGPLAHERACDLEADARRPRSHKHAQILDGEIHGVCLRLLSSRKRAAATIRGPNSREAAGGSRLSRFALRRDDGSASHQPTISRAAC